MMGSHLSVPDDRRSMGKGAKRCRDCGKQTKLPDPGGYKIVSLDEAWQFNHNPIGESRHMTDFDYLYSGLFRYQPPKPKTLAERVADLEAENKNLRKQNADLTVARNREKELLFGSRYGSGASSLSHAAALEYSLRMERENTRVVRDQRDKTVTALQERENQLRAARTQRDDAIQKLERARKALS